MDTKQKEKIIKSILDNPMDREVWIEAGKACEWKGKYLHNQWVDNAIKFHEINLTQGWSEAVKYLQDLITPQ